MISFFVYFIFFSKWWIPFVLNWDKETEESSQTFPVKFEIFSEFPDRLPNTHCRNKYYAYYEWKRHTVGENSTKRVPITSRKPLRKTARFRRSLSRGPAILRIKLIFKTLFRSSCRNYNRKNRRVECE